MPFGMARSIIDQIAEYEVKAIVFTGGGEPLLHEHAVELIEHAASAGVDVGLITNGSLLNGEKTIRLLRACRWMRISLDADGPQAYCATHGMDTPEYEHVLDNIREAARMKAEARAACTLAIGYLTGPETRGGIERAARQMSGIGVDCLHLRPFLGDATPIDVETQHCLKFESSDFYVLSSAARYEPSEARGYTVCHAAHFMGVIQADARMTLCCHLRGQSEYCIGDLTKESLRAVWEGPRKSEILQSLDISKCLIKCRGDEHNKLIEDVVSGVTDASFL
jgi:sulfatase maturation enzyme AslB (radical SAM superfamily)